MNIKKLFALITAVIFITSAFSACGSEAKPKEEPKAESPASEEPKESEKQKEETPAPEEKPSDEGFTIAYPSYMTEQFGEGLTLEKRPEKIVVLSNSAMQILVKLDIKPIAITTPTAFVEYPDYIKTLPVITTGRSDVDAEAIIALQPDLLIMGSHLKESYEQTFKDAGIAIYYTTEGPSITYNEVKEEAIILAEGFGTEETAESIKKEFEAIEKKAADFSTSMEEKSMMILFSAPPTYQQTSQGYLGSMLKMFPFRNLSDEVIGAESRTAPLDLESIIEMNPEILFAISPTTATAEELKEIDEAEFKNNSAVWGQLQAIQNGNIIYLSNEYVTSKGIHIIKSIDHLIGIIEENVESNN